MLNAKKSASAYQIARDLGMRRPTVWSMMHRIRAAMAEDDEQGRLLHGIVEADETYVGGKRRRRNNRDDDDGHGGVTGRGTKKVPVAGAVERKGRVVARVVDNVGRTSLERFIASCVDKAGALLVTDEWSGYGRLHKTMNHAVIRQRRCYADGPRHTNTLEGFWSLVKRAWYGSHHHYSRKYMPLYIAEACYKYNRRNSDAAFGNAMRAFVGAVA
jgi:transposase-like protein